MTFSAKSDVGLKSRAQNFKIWGQALPKLEVRRALFALLCIFFALPLPSRISECAFPIGPSSTTWKFTIFKKWVLKKKKSENELKVRTKERTRKTNNFIENEPRFSKQCRTVPQIILQRWGEFITWRKGRAVEWRVEWNGELASGWRNMHGADCTAVFPLAT